MVLAVAQGEEATTSRRQAGTTAERPEGVASSHETAGTVSETAAQRVFERRGQLQKTSPLS
jgi:hypothetical protein